MREVKCLFVILLLFLCSVYEKDEVLMAVGITAVSF